MEIHQTENIASVLIQEQQYPILTRTRVPGGWLYQSFMYTSSNSGDIAPSMNTTFVPYHLEDHAWLQYLKGQQEVKDGME